MVAPWLLLLTLSATPVENAKEPTAELAVDFGREIQPILSRRCTQCHGPAESEAGLNLASSQSAFAQLDSGERAVVPGSLEASALWQRINAEDASERMPTEGEPLEEEEKELFRRWILSGAAWQNHWAFVPRQPQAVPTVEQPAWARGPIDYFVLARMEKAGLAPAAAARKRALARRLHYDLTGLPPAPEEVEAFAANTSPDAYERLVDRLLAAPQFGERWARHWMDVIRYAETNSYERDAVKPFVWRYRDYLVRAFNEDKPYDEFIREQLSGDELEQVTPESIVATGFYRLGLFDDETADPYKHFFDQLDDIITTTSQAFLGLTINCSRCHDHKIDPIPQEDYYRMLAFYRNIKRYSINERNILQSIRRPEDAGAELARIDAKKERVAEEIKSLEDAAYPQLTGIDRDDFKYDEWRKRILQKNIPHAISKPDFERYNSLIEKRQKLLLANVPGNQLALAVVENGKHPPATHLLGRGNPRVEVREVQPGYPAIFSEPDPELIEPPAAATSSYRRKLLAEWIASEDNLLTARVLVNRLWQHLFGRGIVRTPNNFGLGGTPPTHPKLLDYLAEQLVTGDWRIKPLIRTIVLSNTYRSASRPSREALASDPSNDLFSHQNMRRLSAEEIRDSILQVAGLLNLQQGGPSIYPALSREVLHSQSQPGMGWGKSPPDQQARRSIYIHIKRTLIAPILKIFDFAETDLSCPVRFETTQPTQALPMLNGEFSRQQAARLAERAVRESPGDRRGQVERILQLVWQRPVTQQQVDAGLQLMSDLKGQDGASAETALETLSLVALNSNEFLYLD